MSRIITKCTDERVEKFIHIVSAIHFLHEMELVHGDIKGVHAIKLFGILTNRLLPTNDISAIS